MRWESKGRRRQSWLLWPFQLLCLTDWVPSSFSRPIVPSIPLGCCRCCWRIYVKVVFNSGHERRAYLAGDKAAAKRACLSKSEASHRSVSGSFTFMKRLDKECEWIAIDTEKVTFRLTDLPLGLGMRDKGRGMLPVCWDMRLLHRSCQQPNQSMKKRQLGAIKEIL